MTLRRTLHRTAWIALISMSSLLTLSACGGGGGGGDAGPVAGGDPPAAPGAAVPPPAAPPVTPPAAGQPPPPATPAPGSAGVLYVQTAQGDDNGYGGLDLATGLLTIVRGNGGSGAAPDGTEFVTNEIEVNELLDPDAHTSELVIFGPDGRATARFGRGDFIHGPVRLSADRQRVAFGYEDEGPSVKDLLNISDRSGRVLARFGGLDWWDWAPDGGLYATGGDAIYRIDPGFGAAVVVQRFPGDRPTSVAVSPDGTRLAFSLGDRDARRNHVWVMNVDGSGLRQLTTSPSNEDDPAWSPDGRQLAVRQGLVYGVDLGASIPCANAWLVPADGTRVNLAEGDTTTPARQVSHLSNGRTQALCTFGRPDWRPAVALPARAGTAPQGGGLNQGLGGRLFFDGAGSMRLLDLATGTTTVWPGDGGAPYPSADGSELLFNDDDDAFVINRSNGSVAARIPAFGFLLRPQLSPDGQTIAASGWLDDGPSGIAVQLFRRNGTHIGRLAQGWETSAWLPDGRLLLAVRERLGLADAVRGTLVPLATLTDPVRDLAVSPDGQRFAFTMAGHVWVMGIDGTGLRQLTASGGSESAGSWSPDGRFVLVRPDGACDLTAVPADGERVVVGNTSVATTAWVLQAIDEGRARNVCAFSQPHWAALMRLEHLMTSQPIARRRRLLAEAALCFMLAACGGGGDAAGDASPSPAPPPGAGGGVPAPTAAPTGRLWHNNYALDIVTGTQVAHLDNSAPTLVDPDRFAVPWPDGSQYVLTDFRPGRGETTITVKETGTRRVLYEVVYQGYAGSPRPSPASKEVVLMTVGDSSVGPADYGFINLRTSSFIDRFPDATISIDWLPDGRYLQLGTDGQIAIGTLGGARNPTGSFNLQGRQLGSVRVNAQGTQWIVTLTDRSTALTKRDLWVANIDGSSAGRLTSTDITSYGRWSPDGRHIAFDADTGTVCTGAGCIGTCELWVVPSTARNADPLSGFPGEAARLSVRNDRGGSATLGCELLAWVR